MREILFRGKCVDSGEWVYGVPIKKALVGSHDGYYPKIIPECDGRHQTVYSTAIKEETLGQYTGLTDKNGTKIFEGDIVEILLSGKHGIGIVEYGKSGISAYVAMSHSVYSNYVLNKSDNFIVLGNIYDNPELMEATK